MRIKNYKVTPNRKAIGRYYYYPWRTFFRKKTALKWAKMVRENGLLARVISENGEYTIYISEGIKTK
jgi:hypothetical protein